MHHRLLPLFWMIAGGSFGRTYVRRRKELRRRERSSREAMERAQWTALQRLLTHAYENVPFYRKRLDEAGTDPSRIRTPEDFRRVPTLTRQHLQQNLDELVASNFDRSLLRLNQTGGSTGNPVAFYDYESNRALQKAVIQRSRSWAGFEEGQKVAIIWGADRDIPTWSWLERQKVYRILRQRWLNSYDLTPDKMKEFAELLIRWRPRYILAYAASLYMFASFLRENDLERIRPVAVETSAEKLFDYQRELIEDVFQCKAFDSYGSRDVPNIAFECVTHSGLHVISDNVYVELLANGEPVAPGEIGEIVVTKLTNLATPLIRYQIGDLARADPRDCPCGRPFPLLSEIIGRSNDVIATPSGNFVHGAFFNHLFFAVEGLRQFQVRQRSLDRLEIAVRADHELPAETVERLCETIRRQLGPGVDVGIVHVEAIEPTATGKHRYIISDVGPQFANRGG